MKFWVGVTDNSWFDFLSKLAPDEVNFWQPGGTTAFRRLQPWELFLFKLHAPLNYIAGGGFFVSHSFLPLSLAWETFEQKNGTEDFEDFRSKIMHLRRQYGSIEPDPTIGCIILAKPFFFPRDEWIPAPENWSPGIVQGKTYAASEPVGSSIWAMVQERLARYKKQYELKEDTIQKVAEEVALYGSDYLTHARLGQGAFRVVITDVYNRKCAITQERTLPVLEAAHIKPYAKSGPHKINNGLLLRSDLHKLFDLFYLTITPDFHVEVSKRIKEEYKNGREYYALHGKELNLPSNSKYLPSKEYIEWHNQRFFAS
jgi:putative restriction endonuclease